MTYAVYSDSSQNHLVASGGTVTVTRGEVPDSKPITLPPGLYFWGATYSGDDLNAPTASKNGSEIELVIRQQSGRG